jgi:hypothetical protein
MIVQYNTPDSSIPADIAPYPLKIFVIRVTDENAAVRFLAPNHPVLNYPIKSLLKILKVGLKNRDYITLTNLTKPSLFYLQMTKEKVLQMEPY